MSRRSHSEHRISLVLHAPRDQRDDQPCVVYRHVISLVAAACPASRVSVARQAVQQEMGEPVSRLHEGESRLPAAVPMDNPYCSCEQTWQRGPRRGRTPGRCLQRGGTGVLAQPNRCPRPGRSDRGCIISLGRRGSEGAYRCSRELHRDGSCKGARLQRSGGRRPLGRPPPGVHAWRPNTCQLAAAVGVIHRGCSCELAHRGTRPGAPLPPPRQAAAAAAAAPAHRIVCQMEPRIRGVQGHPYIGQVYI